MNDSFPETRLPTDVKINLKWPIILLIVCVIGMPYGFFLTFTDVIERNIIELTHEHERISNLKPEEVKKELLKKMERDISSAKKSFFYQPWLPGPF